MNIIELLNKGSNVLKQKKISSYQLDSELLLSKVLKQNREKLLVNLNQKINEININKFNELIYRRSLNEPIAYIFEEKEFWSKKFYVDRNTLIPRPETELLLYSLIKTYQNRNISILDIGTGSGCILISLLHHLKNSKGVGIDISKKTILVAKKNAKLHKISKRINFIHRSIDEISSRKFDLVVSNPPYIRRKDIKKLQVDIKNYEPILALDGGNDGLDLIRKVIYKTSKIIKINGRLALEIGNEQYRKVSKILIKNNFKIEHKIKDYKDNIRGLISIKISN
tara:strand:- start:411 stop:1256 length:846 start_codon:yes stop_codon:yes gene_type:complete